MEQKQDLIRKQNIVLNHCGGITTEKIMGAVFMLFLLFTSSRNFFIFHTAVEISIAMVAFGTFIVASNTYKISGNDFFMFLGTGYAFVGILGLLHTFSYKEFNIFPDASMNMVVQFWIAARLLELGTVLVSLVFVYKKIKNSNFVLIFLIFFAVFTLFVLSIMYFKVFPLCWIERSGYTEFKKVTQCLISGGFCFAGLIFSKARRIMDKKLLYYLCASMISTYLCEIMLCIHNNPADFASITGHILKVIAFYFLYRAIIVSGLQRPFDDLIFQLDKTDLNLKEEEKQRLLMEEAIAQNEQCYDLIINNSKDGIVIHSEGKLIFANSAAAGMLGAKDSFGLIGMKLSEFVHNDYFQQGNKCSKKRGESSFVESKITRLDGRRLCIESSTIYIIYRGKPAVLTMFRDISYRKKIESLKINIKENEEKLNQSKEFIRVQTEFFTNISHELKTPLNVILSAIQLLMMSNNEVSTDSFNDKLNSLVRVMRQNCFRLLRLVNNLIDISKIDAGYLSLHLENHNIVSVVEDISLSVAKYVERKDVELVFDTDTEEKEMAIDADKIERIILNLLSNAIKFTNKGDQISVRIKDKGDKVLISVKDTGVGIPEDKINIIFDRFGQVDKTLTRNREGSGVGLALVKNLVELHEGSIEVNSKIGEGSEFIIELPVKIVQRKTMDHAILYNSKVEKINIEFSDIYAS
ncbi:MAG: MASE3 domain-containing protein [Clostridiaceae bacterium]